MEIRAGWGSLDLEIRAGGGGLVVPEIWVEEGVKKSCHLSGGVDFFWNNPMVTYGICSMALRMWMARFVYELHGALVSCLAGHNTLITHNTVHSSPQFFENE